MVVIRHSAEGTTWKKHMYIKRVDGTYYYPDSYEGGRHISDLDDSSTSDSSTSDDDDEDVEIELDSDDIDKLAWEVIRGNFENGEERRERLGELYSAVQNRVNELWGDAEDYSVSDTEVEEEVEDVIDEIVSDSKTVAEQGLSLTKVFSVYLNS